MVATKAGEILRVLKETPIWHQYLLTVQPRDEKQAKRVLMVPAWEPLMTLFADSSGEWALWTPEGFYDASVIGDEFFGWQVSQGWNRQPRYFRADQFREDLERPAVMRRILETGNLDDAMKAAKAKFPGTLEDAISNLSLLVPHVKIVEPRHNQTIAAGEMIRVLARVDFPKERNPEDYAIRCYVNGVSAGEPTGKIQDDVSVFEWRALPTSEDNLIRINVEPKAGNLQEKYGFAEVDVRATPQLARRKLYTVALAADDYSGENRLRYAVADARRVISSVRSGAAKLYEPASETTLVNHNITPATVRRSIERIHATISDESNPQSLLFVFVAGHGVADGNEYYFLPPASKFDQASLKKWGISWQLLRQLGNVPCRKIFLLDTCYSGNVVLAEKKEESIAYHWKAAIRPLRRTQALVLTATAPGIPAFEPDDLKHGYFTYGVLRALSGEADGHFLQGQKPQMRDGIVDVREFVNYVVREVRGLSKNLQQPQATPSTLGTVPLVRPGSDQAQ